MTVIYACPATLKRGQADRATPVLSFEKLPVLLRIDAVLASQPAIKGAISCGTGHIARGVCPVVPPVVLGLTRLARRLEPFARVSVERACRLFIAARPANLHSCLLGDPAETISRPTLEAGAGVEPARWPETLRPFPAASGILRFPALPLSYPAVNESGPDRQSGCAVLCYAFDTRSNRS